MIALIVIPLCVIGLVALVGLSLPTVERNRMLTILVGALGLRLLLFELVMRRVAFFSHGVAGGDCLVYEAYGSIIAQLWHFGHVHFVTETEMPQLGQAALPCNVLALLEYLNGSSAPLAGTAIIALLASWTALIIYQFIRDSGGEAIAAERVMLLVLFGPSFLYYTSDTYKDGVNAFLVVASLVNTMRIAQRFQPRRLVLLGVTLTALWFVRHYMVFLCLMPLSLGILGVGRASVPRRIAAALFLTIAVVAMVTTGLGNRAAEVANTTYATATSANALAWNASMGHQGVVGSGIVTTSYPEALLYTIAAPFPWQLGSIGFQLGKIEAFVLYWFLFTAYKNRHRLWADHRAIVIMLATFIVPATLAYATTLSNIGLIVRQRMPIVIAIAMLAGLAYQHRVPTTRKSRAQIATRTARSLAR